MIRNQRSRLPMPALVGGAVLLAIGVIALHPHTAGHHVPQMDLREIGGLATRDRLVHGILFTLLGLLLSAMACFAVRRGLTRLPVSAGLVAFAAGICSLLNAGLIDGYIVPALAARFAVASPSIQVAAVATLTACSVAVNVLTAFAIVAMAIAVGAWSLDLVRDPGESRVAGSIGFVCAAVTVATLGFGGASLGPHTLMAVTGTQGVWYVCLAVLGGRAKA